MVPRQRPTSCALPSTIETPILWIHKIELKMTKLNWHPGISTRSQHKNNRLRTISALHL